MIVFYDIETTGTDIKYDQALQFAAILTDDSLNEVDRFEMRCQLLPWVTPSPMALLVTGVDVDTLSDPELPTFFEMMVAIRKQLLRWGQATFVGYNSMRFDEPILQRAFWQALLPPYLTVTGGNARLDMLALVRAVAHLHPGSIEVPVAENGKATFRLDQLAPKNGFNAYKAHDALGDVEATVFVGRLLSKNVPKVWELHRERAPKAVAASVLAIGQPVLVLQNVGGRPLTWFGQRVDRGDTNVSHAIVAKLTHDRRTQKDGTGEVRGDVRRIALNQSPLVFTLDEAETLFGLSPSSEELLASEALASDEKLCTAMAKLSLERSYPTKGGELEETIFRGFPTKADEKLMKDFHESKWQGRLDIATQFDDERFRRLAMRIIFASRPDVLPAQERARVQEGITRRITANTNTEHPWRSAPDALTELASLPRVYWGEEKLAKIESWLERGVDR